MGKAPVSVQPVAMNLLGASMAVALLAATPLTGIAAEIKSPRTATELEREYLACDRKATTRKLSAHEAHACSLIAEALLQSVFEGDSERLLAWWRITRKGPMPATGP
jgi:hypothetical protein